MLRSINYNWKKIPSKSGYDSITVSVVPCSGFSNCTIQISCIASILLCNKRMGCVNIEQLLSLAFTHSRIKLIASIQKTANMFFVCRYYYVNLSRFLYESNEAIARGCIALIRLEIIIIELMSDM